jgi:hypothetical protein
MIHMTQNHGGRPQAKPRFWTKNNLPGPTPKKRPQHMPFAAVRRAEQRGFSPARHLRVGGVVVAVRSSYSI